VTEKKTTSKVGLTAQNIAHVKTEFMKLPDETRRKVLLIANALDEQSDDEELIHSTVWYFSQKKNQKELDKVFSTFSNNGFYMGDAEEKGGKGSSIPNKVKILYPEA
jgi:hypothetical protein